MPTLAPNLPAEHRVNLAIDVADVAGAEKHLAIAKNAGARVVKMGLEFATNNSWREASAVTEEAGLDWVADAKVDDIPNTTKGAVKAIANLPHPPVGITIHAKSGIDSLKAAQEIAEEKGIMLLAVTHLTSIGEEETYDTYELSPEDLVLRLARNAVRAGVEGLVCSAQELTVVKADPETGQLFTMIPGTRSATADKGDQKRSTTPQQATEDGADLLVIGRQVTGDENPAEAFTAVVDEIQIGLSARKEGNA